MRAETDTYSGACADLPSTAHTLLLVASGQGDTEHACRAAARELGWHTLITRGARDAVHAVRLTGPRVVAIEFDLGDMEIDGVELVGRLRACFTGSSLVLLAPSESREARARAFELGVNECVTVPFDPRELCARLRILTQRLEPPRPEQQVSRISGQTGAAADAVPSTQPHAYLVEQRAVQLAQQFLLSPRETEILKLLACGVHPKEIATHVGCGYASVRTHLRRLSHKVGCSGTREMLVRLFTQA